MEPVLIAVFAVLLGAWVTYRLAGVATQKNRVASEFNKAAEKFRTALHEDLKLLENIDPSVIGRNYTYRILMGPGPVPLDKPQPITTAQTFRELSGVLRGETLKRFRQSWQEYQYPESKEEAHKDFPFIDYMSEGIESIEEEKRQLAISHIKKLLDLAKPK